MRRLDRRLVRTCWALAIFLALYTLVPLLAQARRQPAAEVSADLQARVQRLEDARMDQHARLAVLEHIGEEVQEVRRIGYGVVIAVVGHLLLTVLQIHGNKRRRYDADETNDA